MKVLFRARGLRVPDWVVVRRRDWRPIARGGRGARSSRALAYPLFVKPANLGSSVGISKVHDPPSSARGDRHWPPSSTARSSSKAPCRTRARSSARCSATTTPEASVPGEIVPSREFYDYEAKYIDGGSRLEIPAALDADVDARGPAAGARGVRRDRRRGTRARRLPAEPRDRRALRQRDQHDARASRRSACTRSCGRRSASTTPTLVDRLIALAIERHAEKQQLRTSAF